MVQVRASSDHNPTIPTDSRRLSVVRSDLFQHRLWLGEPGKWQDVLVPFQDFALTNAGTLSETQIEMFREKVNLCANYSHSFLR